MSNFHLHQAASAVITAADNIVSAQYVASGLKSDLAHVERAEKWLLKATTARAAYRAEVEAVPTSAANDCVTSLEIGAPFGGGFFAGRVVIEGKTYALIVAPKGAGEHDGIVWKKDWQKATPGTQSLNDGFANTGAMSDDGHPAAQWCRALRIAGHNDWYLPSRDELEIIYRNLKPGDEDNYTFPSRKKRWSGAYNGVDENGNGHNASSVPVGEAYSDEMPAQTSVADFQEGGPEAFDSCWYWSSTEFGQYDAWIQGFVVGTQCLVDKNFDLRVRAVRKVLI